MKRRAMAIAAAALLLGALAASTGTASAETVNFGCSKGDPTIGAKAFYSSNGPGQWRVTKIVYSYSDSGGGKSNTSFRVYNGLNAVAWTYSTPDDREDRRYKKSVGAGGTLIRRGRQARAYQKTFFDKFGNDPSCGKNGYF